mmetsp:Transcript_94916/g.138620  ORF Transcript_94916/g.138620 Transcript_94916/m.138620 type:complete len:83 (+) Transcript_94916:640-888(+)
MNSRIIHNKLKTKSSSRFSTAMPLEKLEAVTDTPVSNPQAAAVRATANQQEIDSVRVDSGLCDLILTSSSWHAPCREVCVDV